MVSKHVGHEWLFKFKKKGEKELTCNLPIEPRTKYSINQSSMIGRGTNTRHETMSGSWKVQEKSVGQASKKKEGSTVEGVGFTSKGYSVAKRKRKKSRIHIV